MSECIGAGCTSPGCSGRNAQAVNHVARLTPEQVAGLRESLSRMAGSGPVPKNRATRRQEAKAARKARRGRI